MGIVMKLMWKNKKFGLAMQYRPSPELVEE
jgi:hypothetical protein